ncbi:MAG: recombination mediator RecR [Phycisphaerales bacterium]
MNTNPAYTDSMNRLIGEFARLPGIGRRTAERLAFHVLKSSPDEAMKLAKAIEDVKTHVRHCSVCFNLTEADPCPICDAAAKGKRNPRKILVVEQPKDVILLEQTGVYDGVYHVLLGRIAPLEGVGPGDLTIAALEDRVAALAGERELPGGAELPGVEVILGTNPNLEGDGTALMVAQRLARLPGTPGAGGEEQVHISRLARGLPAGSQLDYANKSVLSDAIVSRTKMG